MNAHTKGGKTALMLAAQNGKDGIVPILLGRGAEVNARDGEVKTALMYAMPREWEQQVSIMKQLLVKGLDVNAKDNQGRTTLTMAIELGFPDRVKLLLDNGAEAAASKSMTDALNHALLKAASNSGARAVAELLRQGADVNFADREGKTVLMIATEREFAVDLVKTLLDSEANVNTASSRGETALMLAAGRYSSDVVKLLLNRGAEPNARDKQGNTALIRAATSPRSYLEERNPLIELLLDSGADPKAHNTKGVTALMGTAFEGNAAMLLLLEKGVDVNARDEAGNTALLYAASRMIRRGSLQAAYALLEKGADANAANQDGETALLRAATQHEVKGVELLLQKGSIVNIDTKEGRTPLMAAIDAPVDFDNDHHVVYSLPIAKLFIEHGADVNAHDAKDDAPLRLALQRNHADIVPLLKEAGAQR